MIDLSDVVYKWPGTTGFGLSVPLFHVAKGSSVLLLGDSGSGKSTLLSLICGTITADQGAVHVAGTDLTPLSGRARDRFRADHIGVVFQQFNLLPFASVLDNILLPLQFARVRRNACADPVADAKRLCTALGLPAGVERRTANQLSVGQQQRVAVARALIGAPPLVIADEPTSALDEAAQSQFLDLMFNQTAAQGATLLMVSHNPRLGDRFDRVVTMSDIAQTQGAVS